MLIIYEKLIFINSILHINILRRLNTYDTSVGKVNTWQKLVFEIKKAVTGSHTFTNRTMYKVGFYPDMGFALSTMSTKLAGVQVFKEMNNMLKIKGLQLGKATIFNALGKQVMSSNFTSNNNIEIALPRFTSSIYFVKLEIERGRLNKKNIE